MPYKDQVNEHVKRVVSSINRRFIAHTDLLGSTNAINSKNPSVEPQGESLMGRGRQIGGGQGCASWSAGTSNKHYSKSDEPSEKTGGAILGLQDGTLAGDRSKPKYSQTSYKAPETDNTGKFGALGDAFSSRLDAKPLGPVAANSRSGYAHKDDSPLEGQSLEWSKQHGLSGGMIRNVPVSKHQLDKKNREKEKFQTLLASKTPEEWAEIRRQEDQKKIDAFNALDDEGKQAYNDNWIRTHPEQHEMEYDADGNGITWVRPPPKQNSFWEDFGDTAKSMVSVAKPFVGMIPGVGKYAETAMDLVGLGKECCCPRLKSGKAPKRCKCGAKLSGGSGFAAGTHMDVGSGETFGISSRGPTRGAGRPRGRSTGTPRKGGIKATVNKSGGAVLGLVKSPVAGKLDDQPPAYGSKKVTPKSTAKRTLDKPTTKADMPSSTLSGGKRSARAEIVKKIMKERGVKLMEASSIVKKEGLYKP
jgi:hypothetical protein